MTEIEVMNDLMFCASKDCVHCSREATIDCDKKLMKDARSIIKMQMGSLEVASKAIKDLERDNKQLQTVARYTFTEYELIKAVNDIVHYCLDNDEDLEDNQDVNIIRAMLDFGKLLPSGGKLIIHPNRNAPEIKLDK